MDFVCWIFKRGGISMSSTHGISDVLYMMGFGEGSSPLHEGTGMGIVPVKLNHGVGADPVKADHGVRTTPILCNHGKGA
jgi:hypothetical protein